MTGFRPTNTSRTIAHTRGPRGRGALRVPPQGLRAPVSSRCTAPGRDGPRRCRRHYRAVVDHEVRQRLAHVRGDLRPDLVDAIAPPAEHLGRGTERHVEGDGLVEVVADLVGQVLAREGDVLEAGAEEHVRDRVRVRHRERPRPAARCLGLLGLVEVVGPRPARPGASSRCRSCGARRPCSGFLLGPATRGRCAAPSRGWRRTSSPSARRRSRRSPRGCRSRRRGPRS